MAYLTSRNYNTCSLNDIFHIVKTGDTSQGNPDGSSYKTNLYQILDNSSNCFQNLYVKNIHGCPTDLFVQPLDEGNVYFGDNNAARGFMIDLPTYGGTDRVKVGVNNSTPSYTLDFYSKLSDGRIFWADDYTSTIFNSFIQFVMSGGSTNHVNFTTAVDSGKGGGGLFTGMGTRGLNNTNSVSAEVGDPGDAFFTASDRCTNLNIVKRPNATDSFDNPDSIRFYASVYVDESDPHMIIRGKTMTDPSTGEATVKGYVGIGTVSPTQKLDVGGNARFRLISTTAGSNSLYVTSSGVLTTTASDIRLKENISTIENALDTILSLRGVNYSWKDDETSKNRLGFVAQEVELVNSDLTFINETTEEKIKGVHYDMVAPLLVESVKELNQKSSFEEYTPSSIDDPYGVKGQKTFDDNFMYIKTGAGWKKLPLMDI